MSIPVWPSVLPCFLVNGFGYQRFNNIESTEFGSGYTRSRRKPNGPIRFNYPMSLTHAQLEIFESWIEWEVKDVGWFSVPLKTGAELEDWEVKLTSKDFAPQMQSKEKWLLSLQLQARRQKYLTQGELDAKIYSMPDDFGDRIQTIVKRYNTDYYL